MKLEGIVEKTSTKDSPASSARKWKQKSFCINDKWFNLFVNADNKAELDAIVEGTSVAVEYTFDGKYDQVQSFKIMTQPSAAAAASSNVAHVAAPVSDKDVRISHQAARKDALNFIAMGLPLDVFTLSTKKADKADALYEYVVYYTNKFLSDSMSAKLPETTENNNNNEPNESASE